MNFKIILRYIAYLGSSIFFAGLIQFPGQTVMQVATFLLLGGILYEILQWKYDNEETTDDNET